MKIAIFHNFLDNIGGAEMVSLILARELKADIYTTNIDEEKIKKMGFSNINIFSIGKVPLNAPLRQQLALLRFRFLNLKNKYDFFIISGDWAMSGSVNNKPNLWYVHSPIREIWDLYEHTRQNIVPWILRPVFDIWVWLNRKLNRKYIKAVDSLVCNSVNTKNRLAKFLHQEAQIIHPSIDLDKYRFEPPGDYWLSVNRLISHKRVEMQLQAFAKMPDKKLIIVGSYEKSRHFKKYAQEIQGNCPSNVKIINWAEQKELIDLYANCRGFITTAKDEDFGLTVVEAMASGKPVIAPREGGYQETIIDGSTGKLIENIDWGKLVDAINNMDAEVEKYKNACEEQAKNFDTKVFLEKIKRIINKA